ncbi:MAG: hypothetical protein GY861_15425 [bacterium]|nr:hypothetical protein [bacterium]
MTTLDRDIRISTVGRDDYPELEGKLVSILYPDKDYAVKGIVVGCNRSIGITIVEVEDKDRILACFTGKSAPGGVTPAGTLEGLARQGKTYDDLFDFVVELIEEGIWVAGAISRYALGQPNFYGGVNQHCAYRQ